MSGAVVTDYVLSVTLMWVSPITNQVMSRPFYAVTSTHPACVQALTNEVEKLRQLNNGVSPVPVGTQLCEARQRPVKPRMSAASEAAEQAAIDAMFNAPPKAKPKK